jgi:dihydrofolate synthase/folylpolyglutamate synthase
MSYAAAIDHLHGLTQELAAAAPRRKFDLDHMRVLARALGDPQRQFRSILIAGTNGKGSTAATLAGILAAAGVRTALYTSPHLARVTERIRVSDREQGTGNRERVNNRGQGTGNRDRTAGNGEQRAGTGEQGRSGNLADPCSLFPVPCSLSEIPEEAFARLYFRVDETARQLVAAGRLPHHPSFFETLTALAFLHFAERNVEIAVLEVGMGGRLDATNIVDPLLSVLTDIALDHQEYLGNTVSEIAREKAGILRAGGTLVTLPQHPEANQAIGEAALALQVRGVNAAEFLPGRTENREQGTGNRDGAAGSGEQLAETGEQLRSGNLADPCSLFPVPSPLQPNRYDLLLDGEVVHVRSPLAGEHQRRNLALAIAAAIELRNQFHYKITNAALEAGIANTVWPGRLEFLPPNLLLDVAHNPAGAWALRAAIATLPEDRPRTLIFSCLRDKDLTEMSRILFPLFDGVPDDVPDAPAASGLRHHIVLTHLDSPRAAGMEDLVAAARALGIPAAQVAHDPAAALELARSLTPTGGLGGLIIATGSIYLVGAVRQAVEAE